MRFNKINKTPDSIMRKKWIIASTLALGGVAVLGTTTVVNAEITTTLKEQTIEKNKDVNNQYSENADSKNEINFDLPAGLGTDDVIAHGQNGTAKYIISKKGILYLFGGELSVDDTQSIGRKFGDKIFAIKVPWTESSVTIPENASSMFANYFINTTYITFGNNVDISKTKNMSLMFSNMPALRFFDYDLGDSSNVTNMHGMFKNDKNIERLNLGYMQTKNVEDMSEMFSGVAKLKNLDLSRLDMKYVKNTNNIFKETNLEEVTLGVKNKFTKEDTLPNRNNLTWKVIDEQGNPDSEMFFSSNDKAGQSLYKFYDGNGKKGTNTFIINHRVLIIPSNIGDQVVENVEGDYFSHVFVKVPAVKGYISDKQSVRAFIDSSGTVETHDTIIYSSNPQITHPGSGKPDNPSPERPVNPGQTDSVKPAKPSGSGNGSSSHSKNKDKVIKTNVKITTSLGDIEVSVSGKANEKKTVEVPYREGYTSDKKTVTILINPDGTATTKESVKYKKNNIQVVRNNSLLTTFSDKGNVILYHINGDKLTRSDRLLAPNTDWFSDQQKTIDGVTYLRVATNEWIKATNIYVYESNNQSVKTKGLTALVDTHGKQVKDRALYGETSWFTDRSVMINGKKYYRVATNELVSANDVY